MIYAGDSDAPSDMMGKGTLEECANIVAGLANEQKVEAIFQGIEGGSAFIRVRFGGGAPTLPQSFNKPASPATSV